MESESALFIGTHVKASVIGVCEREEGGAVQVDLSTTCRPSASQLNNVFDV